MTTKSGQLYVFAITYIFVLFSESKFEAKVKLAKPIDKHLWISLCNKFFLDKTVKHVSGPKEEGCVGRFGMFNEVQQGRTEGGHLLLAYLCQWDVHCSNPENPLQSNMQTLAHKPEF